MPKERRLHDAQAYMAQPEIQMGYSHSHGGWGTVMLMVMEQPMDVAHAVNSTQKRRGYEL